VFSIFDADSLKERGISEGGRVNEGGCQRIGGTVGEEGSLIHVHVCGPLTIGGRRPCRKDSTNMKFKVGKTSYHKVGWKSEKSKKGERGGGENSLNS